MEQKLKILLVDKFYFIKGGAERYFFELKKLLEENGHEVIPFSMKHPENFPTIYENYFIGNIEFEYKSSIRKLLNSPKILARIIYSRQAKKKIEKLIQDTKPDLAHLHMIDHQISPSILHSLRKFNIPAIQTVHQYKLICPNYRLFNNNTKLICEKCMDGKYYHPIIESCHKTRFSGLLLAIEMYLHKKTKIYENNLDLFHCPSDFIKQKLIAGGINPQQLIKLYYTIDLDDFPFSPIYENYFIYSGRLSEEKGVLTLLKAMKNVNESKLLIVGDGPIKSELEEFANNNQLKNVEFVGKKDGEELTAIMKKTKFVVVPSEWYDNSPLVIYEAFSMGKPVIGSNIGGIAELIDHENNGLLFDMGDINGLTKQINHLLKNPDDIVRLGRQARKKAVDEFSPLVHYKKIYSLYEQLIQNSANTKWAQN